MFFLNLIYYFIWRFQCVVNKGIDTLGHYVLFPFKWLFFKLPFVRNRYIKLYGSVDAGKKIAKDAYLHVSNNKDWGISMYWTTTLYGGSIAFYLWGFYYVAAHFYPILLEIDKGTSTMAIILSLLATSGTTTYLASYRKDVFKKYFKEFDKIKGWKRFRYKVMTFIFVAGAFAFWLWALNFGHH